MPTDRKAQPIQVGDVILIPAIVVKVEDVDEFHNLIVETTEYLHPAQHKTRILLNTKQVEVVHPSIGVLVVTESSDSVPNYVGPPGV